MPAAPAAAAGQSVFEFPVPNARFNGIVTGADGNLWLTDAGNQSIDRLSMTDGSLTEFPVATTINVPPNPTDITLGADGNVWFLDAAFSYVGKVTPGGDITEYPVGPSFLSGITAGPDGNIWFGDYINPASIGRITPAGAVARYATPQPTVDPGSITTGADGNLWFTDGSSANALWRLNPSSGFTPFPVQGGQGPIGIAAGPDGNLWFGEAGPGHLGRMTMAGVVTQFSINTTLHVSGIASGPDGNVWFGESGSTVSGDMVGAMTPTGRVRHFPLPTPLGRPGKPTAGADGNVWFAELAGNIGVVVPVGPWPPATAWWSASSGTALWSSRPGANRPWFTNPPRPKSQPLAAHVTTPTPSAAVRAVPIAIAANQLSPAVGVAPIFSAAARAIRLRLAAFFD